MTAVSLKINDQEIPLNDFMQEMLSNLMLGYLKAAKEVPEDIKTISIKIQL
ncbi:MAG: hypothetical protein ACFE8A_09535 [Candidatus Hodarchaeota archaeon]